MRKDFALALRTLLRRPGFFFLATFTLGLGYAASLSLFSLLDAVYFRPQPLREPDRLVRIESTSPRAMFGLISYLEAEEIAASISAIEDVVPVGGRGVTLHLGGEPHLLLVDYVSPSFFDALGIPLELGSGFDSGEPSAPQVVVNHRLWRNELGGRPEVIGSSLQLNDTLFTVVGVAAAEFVGLDRIVQTDVFIPVRQAPLVVPRLGEELAARHHRWFELFARLAPGASLEEARAQLAALARRWALDEPAEYPQSGFRVRDLEDAHREEIREGAAFLLLPGLVLLIACTNVANLILARTEARRRELALRMAIGAGRGRIFRQLLAESLLLSLSGGLLGLVAAAWLVGLFPRLVPPAAVTYTIEARLDHRALVFGILLVALTTFLVGLAAFSRGLRRNLVSDLRSERSSPGRFRAQHLLVAGEIGVGVVVLVLASLLVRSLLHGANLRPGFDARKEVATLYLVPGLKGYTADETHRLLEQARERLGALPGVRRASYAIRLPAQGNEAGWASDFVIPGKEPPAGEEAFRIRYTMVGPEYFELMGTRVLRGRSFYPSDGPEAEPVAIVSQTMAERLFRGEDPIGEVISMGITEPVLRRIVGVAEDIRIADLYEEPEMYVYVPYAQDRQSFGLVLLETRDGILAETVIAPAAAEIERLAPGLPVLATGSFERHMKTVLYEERRDAWIAVLIGALALVLTSVGIHGVLSLVTAQRTREIAIRIVLGARRNEVLGLVLHRGLVLALGGAAAGMGASLLLSRLLESRLYGVGARDPFSFGLAFLLVSALALTVSLIPALRATRLDPSETMRAE